MACKTVKKVYKNGWINKQKIECNETNQHCFEIRIGNFIKEPIKCFGYLQKHITIFGHLTSFHKIYHCRQTPSGSLTSKLSVNITEASGCDGISDKITKLYALKVFK